MVQEILRLLPEHGVTELVLGYPKNMDGTVGSRAEKAAAFAETLRQAADLPVTLWDERRTTVDAHNILFNNGKNAKKRKKGGGCRGGVPDAGGLPHPQAAGGTAP